MRKSELIDQLKKIDGDYEVEINAGTSLRGYIRTFDVERVTLIDGYLKAPITRIVIIGEEQEEE